MKSLLKPWVTEKLIKRIKIRDSLSRKVYKGKIDREIFTRFRNKLTAQLRTAKATYYQSEFAKCSGNGKKTWDIINKNIRKTLKSNIVNLKDNEDTVNINDVPNKFIDYFTDIASKLASEVPPSDKSAKSYLKDRKINSFLMVPIIKDEIETVISQLKSSNPVFSISSAVLDNVKGIISPHLANIYNLCIDQGYFPDELKLGRITPVHKKGCKFQVNNYRPVCNLSPFSKILERIIYNRMLEFIDKFNLFSPSQFGFRKNMGTETALIDFIDYIQKGLTKKHSVGSILWT